MAETYKAYMDRRRRNESALYYLVFVKGLEIDEGMQRIAESHSSTVRSWAAKGRINAINFTEWLNDVIDSPPLDHIPIVSMASFSRQT